MNILWYSRSFICRFGHFPLCTLRKRNVFFNVFMMYTREYKIGYLFCRFKHSKNKKFDEVVDDDYDHDDVFLDDDYTLDSVDPYYEEDMKLDPKFKEISFVTSSLRFDKIIRTGLALTRSTAEEAFFAGRFRLNDQKVLKKSAIVRLGDKLDIISNESEGSIGKRVRILDFQETKNSKYKVLIRCWPRNIKL